MAAATNDHKLGILKDKHLLFYSSGGQRSKTSFTGLNTDCLHGHAPSRGSRMRILCLLDFCSLLELHSLAHGPFRLLQSQQFGISKSLSLSLFLLMRWSPGLISFVSSLPLPLSYKNICDYI